MKKFSLLLVLLAVLSFAGYAAAKNSVDAVSEVVVGEFDPDLNYIELSNRLKKMENSLKSGQVSLQDMSEDIRFSEDIRGQLFSAKRKIEDELKFVQKRVEALGEEPKDGSKELEIIAQKRREFNKEETYYKGKLAEVDILLARIDELDAVILNIRNSELLGSLITKQSPLYEPQVFFAAAKQFAEFVFDIIKSPVKWYQELNGKDKDFVRSNLVPVGLVVLFCAWIGIALRLWIMRHLGYRKDIEHPRYGIKIFAAVFVAIAYGVIPAMIIAGFLVWMMSTHVMTTGFFGLVLNSFLYYSLYLFLARALTRVTFAPYNEKWRLVNVNDEKARRLTSAFYFSALMICVAAFMEHVAADASYPRELIYFITVLSSAVKAFCIILIVKRSLWDEIQEDEEDEEEGGEEASAAEDDGEMDVAFRITFFTSLFVIGVFAISIFGYPKLSAFILNRFIASVIVIGLFVMLRKAISEILHRLLLLRFWVKTFKMRRRMILKIDFWLSLIIDPLLAVFLIFTLLSLWGVSTDLLVQSIKKLFFGFTVGGIEISLFAIILGIVAFFVCLAVFKGLRRRLVTNVLDKMDIDDGIKHSLSSGISFFGVIIAAIIAITVMGGNLSNLALIASALSVGIGFGLQNIINNFVSGIIILFERPFKVGDWVIVNNEEGQIKQINIRSTEVETFRKTSIIIPNATLLSNAVTNLTHGNNWSRQSIKVGVAYGSDVEKVKEILLDCAAHNKYVMKNPAPYVLFQDFGPSSLDFELRCYTNNIWNGWIIPSDLRYEINRRFIEEGIEIPFQQVVVHEGEKVAPENQFYARKGKNK